VDPRAVNFLVRVRQGERQAPFYQTTVQQIHVRAVVFNVRLQPGENILRDSLPVVPTFFTFATMVPVFAPADDAISMIP
jgi:hypothetical protein